MTNAPRTFGLKAELRTTFRNPKFAIRNHSARMPAVSTNSPPEGRTTNNASSSGVNSAPVPGPRPPVAPFTKLDDEGVTCSVCHSIVEARLDGSGSFTIRRPALLAKEDGTPIFGDFTDEQILADVPGHKRQ